MNMEESWKWIILFYNWSLWTWLPEHQDTCDDRSAHVHANCMCVRFNEGSVACTLLQVAMSGCCIDWHGLDLCLEPLTMSDKTSSSSLACARFPLGHSLTTRDWDSIRISERSVSSSSPGDSLLTQQKAHIHTVKPHSPGGQSSSGIN